MIVTMCSKLVERRLNEFQRRCGKDGDAALELACYAALPVALNPELLHFLRINFFFDPPKQLPYTVEFKFLTSGLCRAIDVELYEIEPETRNELLKRLMERNDAPQRIRDVATLLWQYVEHHSPWEDRVELKRAQQLTALHFLNPEKAQEWLDKAKADNSQNGGGQEWFIAMRQEIDQLPTSPDIETFRSPTPQQYKKLQDALINAFPSKSLLERLLYFELDKNLNQITQDSNLRTVVFQLIKIAVSQGWLINLVRAAREENPGNSELAAIAFELLPPEKLSPKFDVFLAHNSADKPQVRAIAEKLKRRGLKPWVDEEQIPPGRPFQDEIQQVIPLVKSAAIFFGLQGLGRWQSWELRSLINQCVDRLIPVIPVLLPGVNNLPENLLFLREFRWVAFSNNLDDEQALDLLQWGITGQKPMQVSNSTEKPGSVPTFKDLSSDGDDLSTEAGVDYRQLRNFLKRGYWKQADQETLAVMLKASGRDTLDIENFPCTDLRTIDKLWVKYSREHFGFSVQKRIWESVGKDPSLFGARVGWKDGSGWLSYNKLTFPKDNFIFEYFNPDSDPAPYIGHLPVLAFLGTSLVDPWEIMLRGDAVDGYGYTRQVLVIGGTEKIFSRIETCKL